MELALTIIAGLGALLFLIGYLGFVLAGFKHHFVTGIISAFPVLNIVTIPALWRNASRKIMISLMGMIVVAASWFLGANSGIQKTIELLKGESPSTSESRSDILPPTSAQNPTTVSDSTVTPKESQTTKPYANQPQMINESKMQTLPKKALYRMSFETVPVSKIQTLKDRIVKIITNNNSQLEGRVTNITASSIFIADNELPIANIKQISLMVKKPY